MSQRFFFFQNCVLAQIGRIHFAQYGSNALIRCRWASDKKKLLKCCVHQVFVHCVHRVCSFFKTNDGAKLSPCESFSCSQGFVWWLDDQILHGVCGGGLRLPAFQRHHLQRPQTREPYTGPQGLRQTGETAAWGISHVKRENDESLSAPFVAAARESADIWRALSGKTKVCSAHYISTLEVSRVLWFLGRCHLPPTRQPPLSALVWSV